MKNYDGLVKINQNPNWPYVPNHPFRIVIIGSSGSGKTNVLLNLRKHQWLNIDKTYVYVKDPVESKYQLLFNVQEKVRIKKLKNPKAFVDCF